jgi:uncharacterized YigZ family protein
VKPVETREEAEAFVAQIKNKHKDATHNVPAFIIGDQFQLQWASDDGEPQGTSGAPIVQMLVKEGITNLALVITRYFGGIKLGTGGLVRAYTSTAKLAVRDAGICAVKEMYVMAVKLDYTFHGKLQNLSLKHKAFQIRNTVYEDAVTVELSMDPDQTAEVNALLSDLTGGNAEICWESRELAKVLEE